MKKQIISAAYPFIPAELNLAHAAGTYLPADIFFRLSKFYEIPSRFITGVDVHGRFAFLESKKLGIGAKELSDLFANKYQDFFNSLDIVPTEFLRTDDSRLIPLLEFGLNNMKKSGKISKKKSIQYICNTCDDFVPKSELIIRRGTIEKTAKQVQDAEIDLESLICGKCRTDKMSKSISDQWHMEVPHDESIYMLHERQASKILRKHLAGIRSEDFSDWEFTRDNYYGIALPFDREKKLYLWCDSLISKLLGLSTDPRELPKILEEIKFVPFFGKNIIRYYSMVFPQILRYGFETEPNIEFAVRGWGLFPKNQRIHDTKRTLSENHRDFVRFYLAYTAPDDPLDFNLTDQQFQTVIDSVLIAAFGKYFEQAGTLLAKKNYQDNNNSISNNQEPYEKVKKLHNEKSTRRILLYLEQYVKKETKKIRSEKDLDIPKIAEDFIFIYNIMSCYTPSIIEQFKIFDTDSNGFAKKGKLRNIEFKNWNSEAKKYD